MDKNLYDETLDDVVSVVEGVSDLIAKDFKGTNPFDKEEVPKKKMAEYYQGLSDFEKQALMERHGQTALDYFTELETELFRGMM